MQLFLILLPYIQFCCFAMFVFGVGKYSIRNKIFFIYPGMKHPKATKVEYIFAVVGFSLLTVCMAISGSLGV